MKTYVFISSFCVSVMDIKLDLFFLLEVFSCEGTVENGFHGMKPECVPPIIMKD